MRKFLITVNEGHPCVGAGETETSDVAQVDFNIPHPSQWWHVTMSRTSGHKGIECIHGCAADGPMSQCFRMTPPCDDLIVTLTHENDDEHEHVREWFSVRWDGTDLTIVETKPDAYNSAKSPYIVLYFFRLTMDKVVAASRTKDVRQAIADLVQCSTQLGSNPSLDTLNVRGRHDISYISQSRQRTEDVLYGIVTGWRELRHTPIS